MIKYLFLMTAASISFSQAASAAINLANVECRFSDQGGMKVTISLAKKKNFVGYTSIKQAGSEAKRPIRKISLLTKGLKYKAQVKDRRGHILPSKNTPVSLVRIFRQEPRDSVNSVIEAFIPGEAVLKNNNPRIAKSFVITTASMLFTDGSAASLKGVCWK